MSLQFQLDPDNLFYTTYAKGFRPGGANNPIPHAACPTDFANFGITTDPATFSSDSVKSYEVGAKNNINNRVRLASSIYYIKWNNIQQLIVPPVCQISFIANTGQAVAKGADVQADVSLTSGLTVELAAGYTDARYTQDFRFSNTGLNPNPLVANGDAIIGASSEAGGGQPTAPFTAAAGVEYRFNVFARDTFVRVDGEYEARAKWATAERGPGHLAVRPGELRAALHDFRQPAQRHAVRPVVTRGFRRQSDRHPRAHRLQLHDLQQSGRRPRSGMPRERSGREPPGTRLHVPPADHRHHGHLPAIRE